MKIMIFGTFDGLHRGHLHLIESAKSLGKELIVVVARDERVKKLKGKDPLHDENERKDMLEMISHVDKVLLGSKGDIFDCIRQEEPQIIALGYDQVHYTDKLEAALPEFDFEFSIVRTESYKNGKHKSSKLREKLLEDM